MAIMQQRHDYHLGPAGESGGGRVRAACWCPVLVSCYSASGRARPPRVPLQLCAIPVTRARAPASTARPQPNSLSSLSHAPHVSTVQCTL
eukprot:4448829-Prymnesium_polylepis.1